MKSHRLFSIVLLIFLFLILFTEGCVNQKGNNNPPNSSEFVSSKSSLELYEAAVLSPYREYDFGKYKNNAEIIPDKTVSIIINGKEITGEYVSMNCPNLYGQHKKAYFR